MGSLLQLLSIILYWVHPSYYPVLNLGRLLSTLIIPISVISRPYLDRLIKSLVMPAPTYRLVPLTISNPK
jgi:hypothetical protein